jgi:thymidylate synthase
MTKIWESKYSRDNYHYQLGYLIDFGEPVEVRGRKTMELLNVVTVVTEPWHHCILLQDRRWNPWLALSEFLWIMAGRDDVAALLPYNKNIVEFSDDGEYLYGAYGPRIADQIDLVLERLLHDPSDRRCVIQIWDGDHDLTMDTKDPPCNTQLMFKLRDEKLHMTVINRSNDIHWGLYAVNLPTFGMLQVYMAARLGVGVGIQTHLSNSLHVYVDDDRAKAITERMLYGPEETKPPYSKHELIFVPNSLPKTHKELADICSEVLDGLFIDSPRCPRFFDFVSRFLAVYRAKEFNWLSDLSESYPEFQDWTMAGYMFIDSMRMTNDKIN